MINKLISNIRKTNAPIVVGLDPMLNYIPEHIQKKAFAEFGETFSDRYSPNFSMLSFVMSLHSTLSFPIASLR